MLNRFAVDYLDRLLTTDFAPRPEVSGRLASFDGLLMEAVGLVDAHLVGCHRRGATPRCR